MKLLIIGLFTLFSISTFANDGDCKVFLDGKISAYFSPSAGQPTPLPTTEGYSYTDLEDEANLTAKIVKTSKRNSGVLGLPGSGRQDSVHVVILDSQKRLVVKKKLHTCHLTKDDLTFYSGCGLSNPTYARLALIKINSVVKDLDCGL